MSITDLRGKQVVVTGAASGIGRATALAFAKAGAGIVATDLDQEALAGLVSEIEGYGVPCIANRLDVADEAAVARFAGVVEQQVGAPHVLVNNAGIAFFGTFLRSDLAHWKRVLDVNVMGVVHGCRYFLPGMIAAGGPRHVLNVSSSAANYPAPSMAAYAASKAAVSGFSEVLKMELRETTVRVTTVCPGIINTPIVSVKGNVTPGVTETQIRKLQDYYRRNGCSPDVVARDMVRAVHDDVDVLLTGPGARLAYHLRRMSLGLVRRATVRIAYQSGYLE